MEDKENLRMKVEANLRSVTQSCKGGVPLDRLERDYRDLLGTTIPYKSMGYSSLEAMIRSMPDVINISRNHMGQWVVTGQADATTAHIASLVARQRDSKPSRKQVFHRPYRMQTARGPDRHHSPLHSKRLYTNFFTKISDNNKPARIPQKKAPAAYSAPSYVPAERKKPLPVKKDTIPKKEFEIPPRFLKAQKAEPPAARSPSPVWDEQVSVLPPSNAVKPPVVKPDTMFFAGGDSLITVQTIPSPRHRSAKPKRTVCLSPPALPIQLSAKDFIAKYAAMHKIEPSYRTKAIGQKQKMYISTLTLDGKTYKTYPDDGRTPEEAEEMAAAKAREAIESRAFEAKCTETKVETMDQVLELINRIEGIVLEKPNGIWSIGVPQEYETKYSESLPDSWLELTQKHASNSIEFTVPDGIKSPKGACILRALGTLSGTTTPTSSSSRASVTHDEDTGLDFNQKALRMAFPGFPRLILPTEQHWDVHVTYVASTQDIAVTLIDYREQFDTFSKEMDAFYKAQAIPVTSVHKKKHYVAQVVDDGFSSYHRVRVEETSAKSDLVTCYFVDIGDTEQLKLSQLYELDSSFENCAFQAIHLQLHGLEDYADIVGSDHLVKYVLDRPLIAKIICRGESKFVAELYDTSGKEDVKLNDLLREVVIGESLEAEFPPIGSTTMAYLTHVTHEGDIFVRLCKPYFHVLVDELEKLTPTFELSGSSGLLRSAKPDTVYVAKYGDGMWYRAMLTSSTEVFSEEVEVIYVDYGNASWVTLSTMCELEPISKFLASLPYQAMHCTLSDMPASTRWTEAAARKLCELVPDGEKLIVKVDHPGTETEPPKVTLFRRNEDSLIISLNQTLAFNADLFMDENVLKQPEVPVLAKPSTLPLSERKLPHSNLLSSYIPDVAVPAAEVEVQKRQYNPSQALLWTPTPEGGNDFVGEMNSSLPLLNIPDSGHFDVYVTLAASPSNFLVQPIESAKQLDDLRNEMQQFYSCEDNICELHDILLKEGCLFAALHSDKIWYRARLKKVQGSPVMACVHFIDYGDYAMVEMSNLQVLYKRFMKLPAQAVKAAIAGVKPHSKDWKPDECYSFIERVKERSFVSNIVKKSRTPEPDPDFNNLVLHLELIDTSSHPDQDIYIHKELIEKSIALPC